MKTLDEVDNNRPTDDFQILKEVGDGTYIGHRNKIY